MGCGVVMQLSSPAARPGAYLADLELVTMALLNLVRGWKPFWDL